MKKIIFTICMLSNLAIFAQDHFGGINTSRRVGLLNVGMNPSELINLSNKFEIQGGAFSVNLSNNKVGFKDIVEGKNLEAIVFNGNETLNFNVNAQLALVGVGFKAFGWGFALTSNAFIQGNATDLDPSFGRNITIDNTSQNVNLKIGSDINQRFNSATWGEVGISAARKVFEKGDHLINAGITLKLLFPGAYSNVGVNRLSANINSYGASPDLYLSNINNAVLNFSYSGSLANDFTDTNSYTKALFGGLNGFGTDLGANYIWKKSGNSYKLKAGASVRNIGSMTFTGDQNQSSNYRLSILPGNALQPGLNFNVFENVTNFQSLETALLAQNGANGVTFVKIDQSKEFKVKLPTVINFYADYNFTSKFNLTMFLQRKVGSNNDNDQIATENIFSITPRVNLGFFETYVPLSFNEFAGTTAGVGFRLGGFFLGSNSILTAVISDSKQADLYVGFRVGFL